MASAYREWEPLTHITGRIPQKYQRGLFATEIQVSSGDVHKNIVALGTNVPAIYLFDKTSGVLFQTLKCGKNSDRVTTVLIQEGLEVVVAAGTEKGLIYVFQLPSPLPGRCKELKQFVLPHLLRKDVTSMCLSVNCVRLFAGDSSGTVTSADIEYDKEECLSEVLLKESAGVVQLAYSRGLLLVATVNQAVLYDCELRSIVRIGSQERKISGKFGGQFGGGDCKKCDSTVYVSRPGFRLWRCDAAGQVKATLVFKELLDKAPEVQLAVPTGGRLADQLATRSGSSSSASSAFVDQFGKMLLLEDSCMVIWNDDTLYIIDVASSAIVGVCRDIGPILHVFAKSADEIFLLRTGVQRRLIRLAVASLAASAVQACSGASGSTSSASGVPGRAEGGSQAGAMPQPPATASASLVPVCPLLDGPLLEHEEPTNAAKKFKDVESKLHSGLDNMKKGLSGLVKSAAAAQRRPSGPPPHAGSESLPIHAPSRGGGAPLPLSSASGLAPAGRKGSLPGVPMFEHETELVMRLPVQGPKKADGGGADCLPSLPEELRKPEAATTAAAVTAPVAACISSGHVTEDATVDREPAPVGGRGDGRSEAAAEEAAAAAAAVSPASGDGGAAAAAEEERRPTEAAAGAKTELVGACPSPPTTLPAALPPAAKPASPLPAKGRVVKEARKEKKSKPKKASEVEVAASQRFRALYDQLASNLVDDVPTIAYQDYDVTAGSDGVGSAHPAAAAAAVVAATAGDVAAGDDSGMQQQWMPVCRSASPNGAVAAGDRAAESAHCAGSGQRLQLRTAADGSSAAAGSESSAPSEPSGASSPTDYEPAIYDVYRSADADDSVVSAAAASAFVAAAGSNSSGGGGSVDPLNATPAAVQAEVSVAEGLVLVDQSNGTKDCDASRRKNIWPLISEQWTECGTPKTIKCVAACNAYVSYVDKDDSIHYSRLKDSGALEWRRFDVSGSAIALSYSGDVSWRLAASDGTAFAGSCRTQALSPTQIKWTEAVHGGVTSVAVGESAAWYIKEGGRLHIHDGVSRERPLTRSREVECKIGPLSRVAGRQSSALLALTATGGGLLRYDGADWHAVPAPPNCQGVSDVALSREDVFWVTDCAGGIWFADLAALASIEAAGYGSTLSWWQVNYQLSLAPNVRRKDAVLRLAPDKRNRCLVSVADNVVVLSAEPRKILHVRQGHVVGHQWVPASFPGIALSARWDVVNTSDSENLWLVQSRHELFCYSVSTRRMRPVVLPVTFNSTIGCISGSDEALWVLFEDGRIFVSSASHGASIGGGGGTVIGLAWTELEMSQLSEVRLRHVSVGRTYVWAVDEFGTVYVRVGAMAKQSRHMSPAWAPVESKLPQMGAHFTSIHASNDGKTIWAVDSKDNVFARRGVSADMPLGLSWVQVIGSPVKQLALTNDTAWALTPDGEVMCRAGVTSVNITGEYWKILPSDHFKCLAASLGNHVWAISAEGQILEHRFRVVGRVAQQQQQQQSRPDPELDHDWELI